MKIAPKSIESYLARPEHRTILLYGPDSGLVRERAKRLSGFFLGQSSDPFALVELSESRLTADPGLLGDELSAISMMAPKRVIMIRDAGEKLTRLVEDSVSCFNDATLLIICADELSTRSSLRSWFEKERIAAAIACYRDDVRDVQDVIRKTFDAAGIRAGRDITDYLSQQLGNDRYVTYQELEKLITYAGESKTLTLRDTQALVDYNKETNFDDMINAIADRNVQKLDKHLMLLLREGSQPIAYLRALQRYFNRLYAIRAQVDGGKSAEQVVQSLRPPVFFKQVPVLTRHIQNWSSTQIIKGLQLLARAELASKTSDVPMIPASSRHLLQITQIR